jgi:uncharacterized protein
MLPDLVRALGAGVAAVALPGYFWAAFLRPTCGLAERLGYSCALSLASVPVVALVLAHIAGSGITVWIAIASPGIVLGSGILAVVLGGAARGPGGPVFPSPPAIRDPRAVALLAAGSLTAFVMVLHGGHVARWLILPILALMVLAAVLAGTAPAPPASQAEDVPAPTVLAAPPAGPGSVLTSAPGAATTTPVSHAASAGPAPAAPAPAPTPPGSRASTSPGLPAATSTASARPARNGTAHPAAPTG